MDARKVWLLRKIEGRSRRTAESLAGQLAHSSAEEKEAIMAGIEFEQWFADACEECQEDR